MNFGLPDGFIIDTICLLISMILHISVGIFFIRFFVRLPLILELTCALFLGIGLATFLFEFLAIFFVLNLFTTWLLFIFILGILYLCKIRYGWAVKSPLFQTEKLEGKVNKIIYWTAFSILVGIIFFTFYHALLFPVDYWDALILYINYGEMTYEQNGFPVLYCLQVGLGLGANYPHLYPLFQAVTAFLFNNWSTVYGQAMPPLASLGTLIVLYYLILYYFRSHLVAILSLLAFRQITYVTSYYIWASDYALVMQYTAIYLFFLAWFLREQNTKSLQPLLLVSAIFPHINYLGWIVWPPSVLAMVYVGYLKKLDQRILVGFLLSLTGWFFLAFTWYARNWLVTGNPVYAFFPEILGGKNINLDVLRSSEIEWMRHGFGAAHLGENLFERLINTFPVLINDYRFAPTVIGLLLPSLLLGWRKQTSFFLLSGLLFLSYIAYQYILSGFYFYHILAVFPILCVFAARFLSQVPQKILIGYGIALIISGLVPGLSFSIMGTKNPLPSLPLLNQPGISPIEFYLKDYEYAEVAPVWRYLNNNAEQGAKILTHDNRYLVFRDDLEIIHLDDCDLVPFYNQEYHIVHQELLNRGIDYYLYIPSEDAHPITQQLGHKDHLDNPAYYQKITQSGDVALYRLLEP